MSLVRKYWPKMVGLLVFILILIALFVPLSSATGSEWSICSGANVPYEALPYPAGTRFYVVKGELGKYRNARKTLKSMQYASCLGGPVYKLYL